MVRQRLHWQLFRLALSKEKGYVVIQLGSMSDSDECVSISPCITEVHMHNVSSDVKKSRFQKSSSPPGSLSGPSWMEDRKKEHSELDECIPNQDDLLMSVHQKWIFGSGQNPIE